MWSSAEWLLVVDSYETDTQWMVWCCGCDVLPLACLGESYFTDVKKSSPVAAIVVKRNHRCLPTVKMLKVQCFVHPSIYLDLLPPWTTSAFVFRQMRLITHAVAGGLCHSNVNTPCLGASRPCRFPVWYNPPYQSRFCCTVWCWLFWPAQICSS